MIELLEDLIRTLLNYLQQFNSILVNYAGGILLLVTAIIAIAAFRKSSKVSENQEAMQRLADAIIKQYNKQLREDK